jgi:serine/threonine protein kinase
LIGKGGSCKVYKILSENNTIYALKKVKLSQQDPSVAQGYMNEIQLLNKLSHHPRIIKLTESERTSNDELLMVLEYGEIDFDHMLQRKTSKSLNFIRNYFEQMLEAVQAMHDENIIVS